LRIHRQASDLFGKHERPANTNTPSTAISTTTSLHAKSLRLLGWVYSSLGDVTSAANSIDLANTEDSSAVGFKLKLDLLVDTTNRLQEIKRGERTCVCVCD
jgi:hypothetical protein